MASFITSYARRKTITSAQTIMDNYNKGLSNIQFVYADTDSLHCISPNFELPTGLEIDDYDLGAWKFESKFNKAKFLRQKCYIEKEIIKEKEYLEGLESKQFYLYSKDLNNYYKLKITVSGMPKGCYEYVNFSNFKIGATYKGKKTPKLVPGGCVLSEIDFTIKE